WLLRNRRYGMARGQPSVRRRVPWSISPPSGAGFDFAKVGSRTVPSLPSRALPGAVMPEYRIYKIALDGVSPCLSLSASARLPFRGRPNNAVSCDLIGFPRTWTTLVPADNVSGKSEGKKAQRGLMVVTGFPGRGSHDKRYLTLPRTAARLSF